jgi:RNase P subunit RPR2
MSRAEYQRERAKKQRELDPEGFKQKQRAYRLKALERDPNYFRKYSVAVTKSRQEDSELRLKHNAEQSDWGRKERLRIKKETFALLGGKCVKCGFSDIRALQIDHVNGGGVKHYKSRSSSIRFYKDILDEIKEGSEKYQLLCANCNWIKRYENGEVLGT